MLRGSVTINSYCSRISSKTHTVYPILSPLDDHNMLQQGSSLHRPSGRNEQMLFYQPLLIVLHHSVLRTCDHFIRRSNVFDTLATSFMNIHWLVIHNKPNGSEPNLLSIRIVLVVRPLVLAPEEVDYCYGGRECHRQEWGSMTIRT